METIKELRKICQSKKKREVLYFRIIRIFSIYFTKVFSLMGFSANAVTWVSLALALAGISMFALGSYKFFIIGSLLLQFANVLDCCDGEIARYTKKSNVKGLWAEASFHFIIQPLIFVFLAFGIYRIYPLLGVFVLGFCASLSILLQEIIVMFPSFLYVSNKTGQIPFILPSIKGTAKKTNKKQSFNLVRKVYDVFGFFYRYSTYSALLLILSFVNHLEFLLLFYGCTYPFVILITFVFEYKRSDFKMAELAKNN